MKGIGLFTREEFIWGNHLQNQSIQSGQLFNRDVDTYKTPSFTDVPIDFRVSLLTNSSNRRTISASQDIGEPSSLLATSAFFALKQACMAHRQLQGLSDYFTLHSPATVEQLRMICAKELNQRSCLGQHPIFQPKGS
jgi:xanthine dehydrogenase molybdopterin-binding subunit B